MLPDDDGLKPFEEYGDEILLYVRQLPGFSEVHERLLEALEALEPTLAHLYAYAKYGCFLYRSSNTCARAHLAMTAHAVRELTNSLPYVLSGDNVANYYAVEKQAKDQVVAHASGLSLSEIDAGQDTVGISTELFKAIISLCEAAKAGSDNAGAIAANALLDYPDADDPSLDPWKRAKKFFMGYTHIDRSFCSGMPSEKKVCDEFRRIETSLSASLKLFYSLKGELRDLLASANEKHSGCYVAPSEEDILNALAFLTDDNLRLVFFSELQNPNWVKPLHKEHAFYVRPMDRATGKCPPWPQGIYLEKMALTTPEDVGEALRCAAQTDNLAVRSQIIDIAAKLPPAAAAAAANEMTSWADEEGAARHWYWSNEGLTVLLRKLDGEEGTRVVASRLAQALFAPREEKSSYNDVEACVPTYFYESRLREVIRGRSYSRSFGFVSRHLKKCIGIISRGKAAIDSSYIVQDLLDDELLAQRGVVLPLCRVLVSLMRRGIYGDPESFRRSLDIGTEPIYQRAALLSLALEVESHANAEVPKQLVALVNEALDSDRVYVEEQVIELHRLIRASSLRPDVFSHKPCISRIEDGFAKVRDDWVEQIKRRGYEGFDPETMSSEFAKQWQHKNLLAFDRGSLGESARQRLDELNEELGKREYEDRHFWSTTWGGPEAQLSAEELQTMEADEVLRFLSQWEPDGVEKGYLGQSSALGDLIRREPAYFEGKEQSLAKLRPCYCVAVLNYWQYYLNDEGELPLETVVRTCLEICRYGDGDEYPGEAQGPGDELSYFNAKVRALELLVDLIKRELLAESFSNWQGIATAFAAASPVSDKCKERERSIVHDASFEFITYNLPCCLGFEGMVRSLPFLANDSMRTRIVDAISRSLDDALSSPAMAMQAGKLSGLLIYHGMAELDGFDRLFGDCEQMPNNPNKQIAFSTALAWWRPSRICMQHLRPGVECALNHGEIEFHTGHVFGQQDCFDSIGKWIDSGFVVGAIDEDDALIPLWENAADDKHLAHSLSSVCSSLQGAANPSTSAVQRVMWLWERREKIAKEGRPGILKGAVWLMKCDSLELAWRSEKLLNAFRINPRPMDLLHIEEELELLAKQYPAVAVEVLQKAAEAAVGDEEAGGWTFRPFAAAVLAMAKHNGGPELSHPITQCMDALARVGLTDLDDQIKGCFFDLPEDSEA